MKLPVAAALAVAAFAASPAAAKTVYTNVSDWSAAVGESPDFFEDFEAGYTDEQVIGAGSDIAPGLSTSAALSIESGPGSLNGSNPIGDFALALPDSAGTVTTLTFAAPITYFGFYYIDAGSPAFDGTTFPTTAASGDSALFGGFTFLPAENVTSIVISGVSGDGLWGLDDLAWGTTVNAAVPLPASLPLLLAGGAGLAVLRRRSRR